MPWLSHCSRLYHPHNIGWGVQMMIITSITHSILTVLHKKCLVFVTQHKLQQYTNTCPSESGLHQTRSNVQSIRATRCPQFCAVFLNFSELSYP
jgi:hypothetical protein